MRKSLSTIRYHLKKLSYILEPKHKRKLYRLFLCIFFSSIFELLGVTAILPFVYAMMDIDAVCDNKYIKPIIGLLNLRTPTQILVAFGVGVVVLYLVKNVFLVFSNVYQFNFITRVQQELQIKMLHAYLSRPYQFFLDVTAAEISRGCGSDVTAVFSTIQTILGLVMCLLTTLSIGTFMMIADPIISLGTLLVSIICVIVLTKVFKPATMRLANKTRAAATMQGDAFNKTVYGIKELMVMGRQDLFVDDYERASELLRKNSVRQNFVACLPNRTIEAFFIIGFMSVVLARVISEGNPANFVPKLAAFALGAFKVLPYISGVTNKLNTLTYNVPFIESAYDNLKKAEEYSIELEHYNKTHNGCADRNYDDKSIGFENIVEVKNIFWKYSQGKSPVLTDASLEIRKGEAIGFVGPSGAGKTTLADIILGLLRPQNGSITLDGRDIFTMPKTWARIVGYVPQSVYLIAGTIRDNVAFGMKNYDDDIIWQSLEKAQLGEFVRSLPDGIYTETGERGIKLSGGQRQRIAIARALANDPELLILDEATSALDNETESAIMESIDSLQGKITMVIVAHRLTTIKNCNRIYRICDGIAKEVNYAEIVNKDEHKV